MAEKEEKKSAPAKDDKGSKKESAAPPKEEKAAKSGGMGAMLAKTPVLIGVLMLLEAVVLIVGFKFVAGGPRSASGADLVEEHATATASGGHGEAPAGGHGEAGAAGAAGAHDRKKQVEINVVEFRAPNKQTGRMFLYDVSIFAATKSEHEEKVKATLKSREAMVKDRIRTIIANMDPEKLSSSEPGLETLRRQVKYQLDEIVGEGLIDEVLVPRCIPFRADY